MENEKEMINKFLNKKNTFAVIGVSRNPNKYGSKVYLDLKRAGYSVFPINPKIAKLYEDKCYPTLNDLPKKPDVVDLVVPSKISERIVKDCKKLGIDKVWFQPGSESEKAIEFCKNHNIKVLKDICVMVKRKEIKK